MGNSPNTARPAAAAAAKSAFVKFRDFLESCPPDTLSQVSDLFTPHVYTNSRQLETPEIQLHCDHELCKGVRWFKPTETKYIYGSLDYAFVKYLCKNCGKTQKVFAMLAAPDVNSVTSGRAQKLGEFPTFGPPTPPRVIKLIGPDRELFLKGRRAELRGLGIGAFAYYRRVVEEQKGRIIEEIGKVAMKVKPSKETAELFAQAEAETQFSTAIDLIKGAIPEAILIDGHNPLTLLHSALSEGLHAQTDEECLELATSIRVVLTELADRISVALKEEADLKTAVSRLLNRKSS
jgi:hypothetical protein